MARRRFPAKADKQADLDPARRDAQDAVHTTLHGVPVQDDQSSLKAGERGPTLIEDFHFREKMTHFDHERIPERVVHARGTGAHGHFQVYRSMAPLTRAAFLQDPSVRTPVFVRFSTVVGFRGSTDLARDVRGFATKFYTPEGNYDLVANNIPVFFIQDGMKFPDLVHSIKPEPHHEMPQASAAHDTFWDFISLMPESTHMIFWVLSDRGIPRSYRMMEGFGVHTFRLVDAKGGWRFVKFHWKPLLGVHAVLWDEAQKISGLDPDFHRRDLWEAIENGAFPEFELGVQVVEEADAEKLGIDLLDPTKIIPEELVPVRRIGKMTLDRNPDNFFAETEQAAFHPGHLVPGIDVTEDPLLQARLFSYLDTQLLRLGGPNFQELPINRPLAPVRNNQRDGFMRRTIDRGRVSYDPNTLGGGCPFQAAPGDGYVHVPVATAGRKVRARGKRFFDHFSQARLFWNSQAPHEKQHILEAFAFELGKVETRAIRERMLGLIAQVDGGLAAQVSKKIGVPVPAKPLQPVNHSVPGGADPGPFQPLRAAPATPSPALSMASSEPSSIRGRTVAVLAADGCDGAAVAAVRRSLEAKGARAKVVAPHLGRLEADGPSVEAEFSFTTTGSVLYDAVVVVGGDRSVEALEREPKAVKFVEEAYLHCKPVAAHAAGLGLIRTSRLAGLLDDPSAATREGVLLHEERRAAGMAEALVEALGRHRFWSREPKAMLPA